MLFFIAAIGKNYELGLNGKLPWEYGEQRADVEHFHSLAKGGAIVLGEHTYHNYPNIQKTFHSTDITVLSQTTERLSDATVVHSLKPIIERSKHENLWVIGGGAVFEQLIPYATKMYITLIEGTFKADTFFPNFNLDEWQLVDTESHPSDEYNTYPYTFLTWKRKN